MAVHHLAGHAVGHAVAVLDVVAVVSQLVHLTAEVLPLVDPHPELASVLFWLQVNLRKTFQNYTNKYRPCFSSYEPTMGIMRQDLMPALIPIMLM